MTPTATVVTVPTIDPDGTVTSYHGHDMDTSDLFGVLVELHEKPDVQWPMWPWWENVPRTGWFKAGKR